MSRTFRKLCLTMGLVGAGLTSGLTFTAPPAHAESLFCVFLIGGCGCDVLGVGCKTKGCERAAAGDAC